MDAFFKQIGLIQNNEDLNLYYRCYNKKLTIILLYVDDILIIEDDKDYIIELKKRMMHSYKMTNLGDAKFYIGINIIQGDISIYFHQ